MGDMIKTALLSLLLGSGTDCSPADCNRHRECVEQCNEVHDTYPNYDLQGCLKLCDNNWPDCD